MKRLAGKVALITGGGAGLGRGMADRFCAEGASVAILEIKPDITRDFERANTALGYEALGIAGDVTQPESVRAAVAQCLTRWGRLDTLVNNAGVTGASHAELVDLDLADWNRVLEVNLTGALICTQHAAPAIRDAGGGSIINMSSISARTTYPSRGAYSVSKAALESLTLQASVELAKWNIRVNSMSLGWFRTALNEDTYQIPGELVKRNLTVPIGRIGTLEDCANLAVFLAGDESTYLTGESIELDGGLIAAALKSTGLLARIRPVTE
jgi:NAD(P)-dependent dehydrogenase (short-subunit alcohol dehydrogenase family)